MKILARWLPALLLAPLLLSGCSVSHSMVTGQKRAYAYSWQQEIELGREADREIVEEMGLYDDPALTAYVARVGEEVLSRSHFRRPETSPEYRGTEFTFRVLDTPLVNAFAIPGGYVYVTRGLLAHLENEAQLAVVLGHEVAHVAARHTSQQMLQSQIGMIGLLGVAVLGEELYGIGEEVLGVGEIGFSLLLLRHGRGHEEESDRLGVEYASLAGYRAAEGAGFFTLLERMQEEDGWFPTFLSSHPDPGKREETVQHLAAEWQAQGHAAARVAQDELYDAIDGMVLGRNPRHGFVEDGTFHHPDLRFRFAVPGGWKVEHEHAQVQMVDRSEEAVLLFRPRRGHSSARDAAEEFITENELRVTHEGSDGWGGVRAYRVEAETGEEEDVTRLLLRFVEHGGRVYLFAGIASAEHYGSHERTFERVMESFGRLTDPHVLSVQPVRLRIVAAPRSAPFRSLVPGKLPPDFDAEDLALVNHLRLGDHVPAGTRLKLTR